MIGCPSSLLFRRSSVMLRGPGALHCAGSMAVQLRLRPLPAVLVFRLALRDARLLNFRHRQSNAAHRPIADQAGHQRQ
jgi:hypothetical protein